jgi:hypothetical protein
MHYTILISSMPFFINKSQPPKPPSPPPEPPIKKSLVADFDERHELIQVLLDIMGSYQNLTSELTGNPPFYSEIVQCLDDLSRELKSARERIKQIEKEVLDGKSTCPHNGSNP